jgi:UDP-N-acetylglucosamine--N-acetylmuramyl-(pentapeptide) pyrophosphoryl-undecaprenol N-acetylglucosamine transferase
VAVAEELLSRDAAHSVLFAGTNRGLEARVLPRLGLPFVAVRAAGLVGTGVRGTLRALGLLLLGLIDAARILRRFRPQACLGVGGYVSFPVVALARLAGVPSAVQEQNARPGLTNRVLAKIIQRVYAGDPDAVRHFPAGKTRFTGNPLRRELTAGLPYTPPESQAPVRILVVGGSQGARALNEAMPRALDAVGRSIEVLHQSGRDGTRDVAQRYGARPGARVVEFIDDMVEAYAWAHLVVARSGALTVAELAAAGRPAVLIPFPQATGGHQEANARAAEDRGAAVCLLQSELDDPRPSEGLARTLESLLGEPDRLAAMAGAAAAAARRGAARLIVDDLIALGEGPAGQAPSARSATP